MEVYTIGHSTRSLADLIALLVHHQVRILVDVRKIPRSGHNPQFNTDTLPAALAAAGIGYRHEPRLGGLRRPTGTSPANLGWRSPGFRAFADHMQSADFEGAIADLLALARASGPLALMCAEAVPWRCHRSLIADALVGRGIGVRHIQTLGAAPPHRVTPFARLEGGRVTYPLPLAPGP